MIDLHKPETKISNFKFPKKLHLTCKDKNNIDNPIWIKCLNKYKEIYCDYEIIIYDNNDIYNLFENIYPEYLDLIKNIKLGAVLSDIFRYLILYLEGGIYSDLDCIPLKKIDTIFDSIYFHKSKFKCCNNDALQNNKLKCLGHKYINEKTNIIVGTELSNEYVNLNKNHKKFLYKNIGLCQWFIISKPKQSVFLNLFLDIMNNKKFINIHLSKKKLHSNVINITGPVIFTKYILDYKNKNNIAILPPDYFCAGSWKSVPVTNYSYIKHLFDGSWLKKN